MIFDAGRRSEVTQIVAKTGFCWETAEELDRVLGWFFDKKYYSVDTINKTTFIYLYMFNSKNERWTYAVYDVRLIRSLYIWTQEH